MTNRSAPPAPGWIAQLTGHEFDFQNWEQSLRPPFDPWCERIPRDGGFVWALRSCSFDHLQSADEVRERAVPLIQRLNGALGVAGETDPLAFYGVGRIDNNGGFHLTVFAEVHERGRAIAIATAEVRDAKGKLIPPPPQEASRSQKWIKAAEENDDIADMLVFAGRADNWFDIYKTIELAQRLAGDRNQLRLLLGKSANECERMWRTANSYRHARDNNRPTLLTTLTEARLFLSLIVRTILDMRVP
jgi:hypothetical protein